MTMRIMDKYRGNKHSQNGEDGLISQIISRINPEHKTCCEFGASSGKYCSNTFALIEQGWKGKMMESDSGSMKSLIDNTIDYSVELYFGKVTPQNANTLIPARLGVLSIDVDNDDYHIWEAYEGEADIVVIEINSSKPPGVEMIPGKDGASYTSMVKLGRSKGYFLVCHTGNLIFVDNQYRKMFPEIIGDGLSNADAYFDKSWL